MSQKISLKQSEQKVFRIATNDGLWDIFIGCFVLLFAIAPLLSHSLGDFWSSFVFLPFWAVIFAVISLVRKYVVTPRIGIVKFGPSRKRKLRKFSFIMVLANIVALITGIFFLLKFNVKSGLLYTSLFGFFILFFSSIAAYFLNFTRLFVYGLLFLLSLFLGEWLFVNFKTPNHGFPLTFGITSGIIIITGPVIFIRLLREFPIPVNDSTSEEKIG
jgi:hypothetical protein